MNAFKDQIFCPNCNVQIKEGIFGSNNLVKAIDILIINEFLEKKTDGYCKKCGPELRQQAFSGLQEEKILLVVEVSKLAEAIVVLSIENPINWEYSCLGLVSGQSISQKGAFSEIVNSGISFFSGTNENRHKMIKASEERALAQMRKKCIDMGGNAILGAKIDIQALNGDKGQVFVSATGSAVSVKNFDICDKLRFEVLQALETKYRRLNYLITLLGSISAESQN
jgi:uncharacterized protein YbjQ (UPF0145 family)